MIIFIYNYDSLVFHFKTYHQFFDCLNMKEVKIILYQKVEVLIIWKLEKEEHQISYLFNFLHCLLNGYDQHRHVLDQHRKHKTATNVFFEGPYHVTA